MARIYVDIETLPGPSRPNPSEIPAPANYKDPAKIAAYQEQAVEDVYRKQSLDSMQGRILCIGWALDDGPVKAVIGEDEKELLTQFENEIIENRDNHLPRWCGHNFQGFDGIWLRRKAIRYGLQWLPRYLKLDRYRGNVDDTMLMWSPHDQRDRVSLGKIAAYLGIEVKSNGLDGSKIYDAWLEGRHDEIATYCKQDVEAVRQVFKILDQYQT